MSCIFLQLAHSYVRRNQQTLLSSIVYICTHMNVCFFSLSLILFVLIEQIPCNRAKICSDWPMDIRGSIVVSIPACHAGNRGSIPRRGVTTFFFSFCFSCVNNTDWVMRLVSNEWMTRLKMNSLDWSVSELHKQSNCLTMISLSLSFRKWQSNSFFVRMCPKDVRLYVNRWLNIDVISCNYFVAISPSIFLLSLSFFRLDFLFDYILGQLISKDSSNLEWIY